MSEDGMREDGMRARGVTEWNPRTQRAPATTQSLRDPRSMGGGRRPRGGRLAAGAPPFPAGRFLSEAECQALVQRVARFATGGGTTQLLIRSTWAGNLRWARNGIISSGDIRNNAMGLSRTIEGATLGAIMNVLDDRHFRWTVRRIERGLAFAHQVPAAKRGEPQAIEDYPKPTIWYDSTYHQNAAQRAELMQTLVKPAAAAGMLSAGYLEVSATGWSNMDSERVWYYPYTQAQYSVTVRVPDGSGSGWAGMDHNDWNKIDAVTLSAIALEKCLRSRNPVRLEPGRYLTILEPQAVGEFVQSLFSPFGLDRAGNEGGDPPILKSDPRYKKDPKSIYNDAPGYSKLGEKVIDARLTVRTDCMDPDLGFPPFQAMFDVFHPSTWITNGVLTELAYGSDYAVKKLGRTSVHPQRGAGYVGGPFHMSVTGEMVSIDEMIATTRRGLLVTRFSGVDLVPYAAGSGLLSGYTRDGLWLIENGKLSKAVKNFRFTEAPAFVLNNVEQVGVPQRIFHPGYPIVAPALKVRDFSFTSLSDSV